MKNQTRKTPTAATQPRRLMHFALCAALTCATLPARAGGTSDLSRASVNASVAVPAALVIGSTQMLKDAGRVSVTGIRTIGKVTTLTLRAVGSAIEFTIEVTAKGVEGIAIATGTVLKSVAVAGGVVLMLGASALLYIPHEIGNNLLHHSRASR
jgi:hypothetical protein